MKVLITGGTGFLGRNLGKKLRGLGYNCLITGRNNKQNQWARYISGCESCPMDISNIESVRDVFNKFKPEVVIHAAATKFVDLSEKFPLECVDVNVLGSMNIARVAIDKGVKTVVGISTDKASPPIQNIYGLSKSLMEKMFTSLDGETQFTCVRYGNVVWSTGSIFPLWLEANKTGLIKSTGPEMRRFFFTVEDAANLVIDTLNNIKDTHGCVFSRKMKSSQISSILDVWCKYYGVKWEKVEGRPGDRQDEFLVGDTEIEYTNIYKGGFLIHKTKVENPIKERFDSKNAEKHTEEDIYRLITNKDIWI